MSSHDSARREPHTDFGKKDQSTKSTPRRESLGKNDKPPKPSTPKTPRADAHKTGKSETTKNEVTKEKEKDKESEKKEEMVESPDTGKEKTGHRKGVLL